LRHNFALDLESLWWVIVRIIVIRIKGGERIRKMIFTALDFPYPDRETFFMKEDGLSDRPQDFIHDTLYDCNAHCFLATHSNSQLALQLLGKW
jgi:hypothetical protein